MSNSKELNKGQVVMLGIIAVLAVTFAAARVFRAVVKAKQTLATAPTTAVRTIQQPTASAKRDAAARQATTQPAASFLHVSAPKRDPFSHPKFMGIVVMPNEKLREEMPRGLAPVPDNGFSVEKMPEPTAMRSPVSHSFPQPPLPSSEGSEERPKIGFRLLATSVPTSGKAEAMMEDDLGKRFTAREGELIADETRLMKVKEREVVLKVGSRLVVTTLKSGEAGENR